MERVGNYEGDNHRKFPKATKIHEYSEGKGGQLKKNKHRHINVQATTRPGVCHR